MRTSDAVLEALAHTRTSPHGEIVVKWLEDELEAVKEQVIFLNDNTEVRHLQGRARALSDVLKDWNNAREVLKRKRA
jgi:hypothetical protein